MVVTTSLIYINKMLPIGSRPLHRRIRNEPCAAGEARMPAKAHGFARHRLRLPDRGTRRQTATSAG
jgi:hypothetical protein